MGSNLNEACLSDLQNNLFQGVKQISVTCLSGTFPFTIWRSGLQWFQLHGTRVIFSHEHHVTLYLRIKIILF